MNDTLSCRECYALFLRNARQHDQCPACGFAGRMVSVGSLEDGSEVRRVRRDWWAFEEVTAA